MPTNNNKQIEMLKAQLEKLTGMKVLLQPVYQPEPEEEEEEPTTYGVQFTILSYPRGLIKDVATLLKQQGWKVKKVPQGHDGYYEGWQSAPLRAQDRIESDYFDALTDTIEVLVPDAKSEMRVYNILKKAHGALVKKWKKGTQNANEGGYNLSIMYRDFESISGEGFQTTMDI